MNPRPSHCRQPSSQVQTAFSTPLKLNWRSPESGDMWYKSGFSIESSCSRSEGWRWPSSALRGLADYSEIEVLGW